jgi:phage protein D
MADAVSPHIDVKFADMDEPVADAHLLSMVIDRDVGSADMAAIMLANQDDIYSTLTLGSGVDLSVGTDKKLIYRGEIVGLEPIYKGGDKSKILIRAMNKLHRLLRKRKSVTFTDKTDQQILSQVVGDAGMALEWKHDATIKYNHVYQHNQTDLEFLRTRAARLGCHVWCIDATVFVKQPKLQGDGKPALNVDDATEPALRVFAPRLSSAGLVKKVTVKGWNPETKELITGEASVTPSKLGSQTGLAAGGPMADEETFTVDHPIWDKAEATALAKARLQEASLTYITGTAEVTGTAAYDLGNLVEITASAGTKGDLDPFNGLYYIMGISHRYNASHAKDDSAYVTVLRLARDAQKKP